MSICTFADFIYKMLDFFFVNEEMYIKKASLDWVKLVNHILTLQSNLFRTRYSFREWLKFI